MQHQIENDAVCLLHSAASQLAYFMNGIFNIFAYQAIAALKVLSLQSQFVAQKGCIQGGSNFCRTGWLGSVTHNAGYIGQGVGNGESYLLFAAAAQPCNGGTCTACCAYGAQKAESRPISCLI